ncbi:MAG: alginate lyase family protein, partial [Anaerolineaceae bacterium]|nr:alginate lyase family protein [Anaerolineaceae bacterium]
KFSADQIVLERKHHFFGGPLADINLAPVLSDVIPHWTLFERGRIQIPAEDVKFIWEPARFGWAFDLARAYLLTRDQRYTSAFWDMLEAFRAFNPVNRGPNWMSGQEVAIRLMGILLLAPVFLLDVENSESHRQMLLKTIIEHAARIPPTLSYARAQHNNHLITEALGLYLAGNALPDHPKASEWKHLGWQWLINAFEDQIDPMGVYAQHSCNYHRLMLEAALVAQAVAYSHGESFPDAVNQKLAAATRWLAAQMDPSSGQVPNYGHNDGARILPLASGAYSDYRSTLQTAARAFLHEPILPSGSWDEPCVWLQTNRAAQKQPAEPFCHTDAIHKLGNPHSWAVLRADSFTSRPAHADQLHVDLWWKGTPIALDPGTYQYNAPPPWANALMRTMVHNTVTIDDRDQMRRAGRFLWVDWAQASIQPDSGNPDQLTASHDGYRRLNLIHQRTLTRESDTEWRVMDEILPTQNQPSSSQTHRITVQWLLPDAEWTMEKHQLRLKLPVGIIDLDIAAVGQTPFNEIDLIRAGEVINRFAQCAPQLGWYSPTYGVKIPALSFRVTYFSSAPLRVLSKWHFSE